MTSHLSYTVRVCLFVMILFGGCGAGGRAGPGGDGSEPVQILAVAEYDGSRRFKEGIYLFNAASDTEEDFSALNPDYRTQSIVVVSMGRQDVVRYVEITGVRKKGDTLIVQYRIPMQGTTLMALSDPYAAVVIPKFTGKVAGWEVAD